MNMRRLAGLLLIFAFAACSGLVPEMERDAGTHTAFDASQEPELELDAGQGSEMVWTDCPQGNWYEVNGKSCSGELNCNYGTESCCGVTYVSVRCHCHEGVLQCGYTDACYRPSCP